MACGIFPVQGLNQCPLHWQAESYPLRHQGSLPLELLKRPRLRLDSCWTPTTLLRACEQCLLLLKADIHHSHQVLLGVTYCEAPSFSASAFLILLTIIYVSFILIGKLAAPISPHLLAQNTPVFYISAVVVQFSDLLLLFSLTPCTPWTVAHQASLSLTVFRSSLKFMSTESVKPSYHFILCCPVLLPSVFPSIRVFPMSQLFASGGQNIGAAASASFLSVTDFL